jgi:hypothetical protein
MMMEMDGSYMTEQEGGEDINSNVGNTDKKI